MWQTLCYQFCKVDLVHKKFIFSYLFILITLLFSLSLSKTSSEKLRNRSISFFSPFWEHLLAAKSFLSHSFDTVQDTKNTALEEEIQQLRTENRLLKLEVGDFQNLMQNQKRNRLKWENLKNFTSKGIGTLENDFEKFLDRSINHLHRQIKALPARVIFRSFDQWNSSVWINAGEKDNEKAQMTIIAKNSPVLINEAVVGMVDYVGRHQSRVKLISDPSITPSVRAIRGGEYDGLMTDYINYILHTISSKSSPDQQLITLLSELKNSLQPHKKSWYLAKGELHGSVVPLGYGSPILKGTGFNYDFADAAGPSRDLRTGETDLTNEIALPILKVDDLLVTTGMDGIFPAGLQVAIVTKINFLKEGDYFYELEAKPIANNLEELSLVFVIPPLNEFEEFIF